MNIMMEELYHNTLHYIEGSPLGVHITTVRRLNDVNIMMEELYRNTALYCRVSTLVSI